MRACSRTIRSGFRSEARYQLVAKLFDKELIKRGRENTKLPTVKIGEGIDSWFGTPQGVDPLG